jgi:hypothetical protein
MAGLDVMTGPKIRPWKAIRDDARNAANAKSFVLAKLDLTIHQFQEFE